MTPAFKFQKEITAMGLIYHAGGFLKNHAMRFRSLFALNKVEAERETLEQLNAFFNMGYETWVTNFVDEHVSAASLAAVGGTNPKQACIQAILSTLKPVRVVGDFVAKSSADASAGGGGNHHISTDEKVRIESQQQDLYYGNLVHGAAVKAPMGEVWCPDQVICLFVCIKCSRDIDFF